MKTHPVQTLGINKGASKIPKSVALKAYEVYCEVYSPQEAMIKDGCRGGFSVGEIIALLYASSFPKNEWSDRVTECFSDMENL